jgi:hypothetical protein
MVFERVCSRVIDWIAFRTTQRYNIVKIKTLAATYWDKDTIMLHAVMQLVTDYVEIEQASLYWTNHDKTPALLERILRQSPRVFRSSEWFRSRERGVANLLLEATFDDDSVPVDQRSPEQAHAAREILEVYLWWHDVRPHRKNLDTLEIGFEEYLKLTRQYSTEDANMLKRIIDVREHLWT